MQATPRATHEEPRPESFDVICAGEALFKIATPDASFRAAAVRLRPAGGAVNVALSLARAGLRVGLAAVLDDDDLGRASRDEIAASGVDVRGVTLARPHAGMVLVDARGGASRAPSAHEGLPPFEIPAGWSSRILLLSGLSPALAHVAALCKAARAARRAGTFTLIDFDASLHAWAGRDSRTLRMLLREVDAARCSFADLAVLGLDVETVRAALRPSAVLVVCDLAQGAVATGPFGEVAFSPREPRAPRPGGAGDDFTAAICAELSRPGDPGESASATWYRVLRRGHGAAARL